MKNDYKYQSEDNPATSQWVDQKQWHDKKKIEFLSHISK
jgi:hypothetical protein